MSVLSHDALELLETDHRTCERLFAEYRDLVRHWS